MELKGKPAGLQLDITEATLTRGEITVARIERVLPKVDELRSGPAGMTEVRSFTEGLEFPEWRPHVAFGLNGNTVYAASNWHPTSVLQWDRNNGRLNWQLKPLTDGFSFSLSQDRNFLAYGDGVELVVADVLDGDVRQRLQGPTSALYHSSFSFAGDRIAAVENGADGLANIYVWEVQTGKLVWSRQFSTHVNVIAFSPEGNSLAVCREATGLCICTVGTDEISLDFGEIGSAHCAFTLDGTELVVSSGVEIAVWSLSDRKKVRRFTGHLYPVESLALAPDGHHLASGSQDGTVRWWDLDTGAELRRVIAHPKGTLGVAVSPDSQYLLSAGKDSSVRLWRLSDRDAR